MSLKAFHIVFITLSTALTAGFGAWCLMQESAGFRGIGVGALVVAVVLIAYGLWFYRKMAGLK